MSNRPISNPLPEEVEPRKFALRGVALSGVVPGNRLARLTDAVLRVGDIQAELKFDLDEQGQKTLTGTVTAQVVRECQRCLGECQQVIASHVNLAMVWDDEHAKQLVVYDPWVVAEETASLYEIVEEELLLNMPFVSYHEDPCVSETTLAPAQTRNVGETGGKENPFEMLKQLKDLKK